MAFSKRVLIVGCGHMGISHAKAYFNDQRCDIVGIVSRGTESRSQLQQTLGASFREFSDFWEALRISEPDIVCISTYPDTHASYAIGAMEAGAHVFLEKPLAETIPEAVAVRDCALRTRRKLMVGYILRQHPSWVRFIELARELGKPLVMRMNLNQQSNGQNWKTHLNLMKSLSPIVDCGVHYLDAMCQMTRSRPIRVHAIGARLSQEVDRDMYNYGQLQVQFEDGSVGWYEAGWGPMMSREAFFVKDVCGPDGSVSMVSAMPGSSDSSEVAGHTKTGAFIRHYALLDENGEFSKQDEVLDMQGEPSHDDLCAREQQSLLDAIEFDHDLSAHVHDALESLRVVLAAAQSVREGVSIDIQ